MEALRANLNALLDEAREREARRRERSGEDRDDGDATVQGDPRRRVAQAYANLELPFGADLKAVKSQYRKLMARYHPDRHQKDPAKTRVANELAAEITRAYDTVVAWLESKRAR